MLFLALILEFESAFLGLLPCHAAGSSAPRLLRLSLCPSLACQAQYEEPYLHRCHAFTAVDPGR